MNSSTLNILIMLAHIRIWYECWPATCGKCPLDGVLDEEELDELCDICTKYFDTYNEPAKPCPCKVAIRNTTFIKYITRKNKDKITIPKFHKKMKLFSSKNIIREIPI